MFQKPGVMPSREFVADDVIFSYNRLDKSPKKIAGYFDHIEKVEATDKHTVVFTLKSYNAEWDYRFGWGYYSAIYPEEVADAGASNWKNLNGTGPFMLTDFVRGNVTTYSKNPVYWDNEKIGGAEFKLPFVDKLIYRNIKDEATAITALRTGKLDIMELVRWSDMEELEEERSTTEVVEVALDERPVPVHAGRYQAVRRHPRSSRAQSRGGQAGNRQGLCYNGHAELFSYPQHPDYTGYYEPLSAMPESVKELFTYNPDKAKKLLAEAGVCEGGSRSRSRFARAAGSSGSVATDCCLP